MNKDANAFQRLPPLRVQPLAFLIVLSVLLVRLQYVAVAPDAAWYWPSGYVGDTRSWWKAVSVSGIAAWMVCHIGVQLSVGWRPRFRVFACLLGGVGIVTLLSAAASDYPYTVWIGYTSSYEGVFVFASYGICAWYAAEMADSTKIRVFLVRVIGCVVFLNAVHGIAEGFGWQFWRTSFGLRVMGAPGDNAVLFRFSDSRMAYGTVFQPNHYGMLMAMAAALSIGMLFFENKPKWRFFWGMALLASLGAVIFSNSRSGILVTYGILLPYIVHLFLSKKIWVSLSNRSDRKLGRWLFLVFPVLLFAWLVHTPQMREAARRFFARIEEIVPGGEFEQSQAVSVELEHNRILVRLGEIHLYFWKSSSVDWRFSETAQEDEEKVLAFQRDDSGWSRAELPGIVGGELRQGKHGTVLLRILNVELGFYSVAESIYAVDEASGQLRSTVKSPTYKPAGWEKLMSSRGYIWRNVPRMLQKAPWLGSGPGSFALVFPNDDLLNKQRFTNGENEDKGHGIWAMLLVQFGIVGSIFYSAPVAYILWRACKNMEGLRIPLVLAMVAYLLCSLTNDSTVGVTPVFCVLMGLALGDASTIQNTGEGT